MARFRCFRAQHRGARAGRCADNRFCNSPRPSPIARASARESAARERRVPQASRAEHLQREGEEKRDRAECADPAVAQNLQRADAIAAGAERVRGVGQTIEMNRAGEHRQREDDAARNASHEPKKVREQRSPRAPAPRRAANPTSGNHAIDAATSSDSFADRSHREMVRKLTASRSCRRIPPRARLSEDAVASRTSLTGFFPTRPRSENVAI